jgi:Hypothetical glycosyl hydrolase family 15
MNPGSAGWRSFTTAKRAEMETDYGMDGLFLDDVWSTTWRPRNRETNSDGVCRECGTDAQWKTNYVGFLQNIEAAAPNRPVHINTDDSVTLAGAVDGFMVENMGYSWGQYMPRAELMTRLTDFENRTAEGKDAWFICQGNAVTEVDKFRYCHALYLLVAGPKVVFRFHNAGDYRTFWDFPEYQYDLGASSGGRVAVGANVWRRDFSAGAAIVNVSETASQTVDLGGTYLNPSGATVTSVTLGPRQGMALRTPWMPVTTRVTIVGKPGGTSGTIVLTTTATVPSGGKILIACGWFSTTATMSWIRG